jgi:hypothetical protein
MSEDLKPVGYWFEEGYGERWPDPAHLVDYQWRIDERPRIVAYLRHAPKMRDCLGYARCRLGGVPDSEMGTGDLSDGTYIWPEGLWIYVSRFSVRIPDDMIEHMRRHDFQVPADLDVATLGQRGVDLKYWEDWAGRNATER